MGYYNADIKLDFDGTNSEKQMMERLLSIMDVNGVIGEWKLPIAEYYEFFPITALIGPVSKNRL